MAKKATTLLKRLYTIPEAAYYLGRSEYSIRELIWSGVLPVIRREGRGSKMWLDVKDLDAYCDKKEYIA